MSVKLPVAIAALLALAAVQFPAATSAPNECVLTGANDPNGRPLAPPCFATNASRDVLDPYSATCPNMPGSPVPSEISRMGCRAFYIMLVPDANGNPVDGVQLDRTLIWQENNNCPGLQRSGGGGCIGPDLRFFTL